MAENKKSFILYCDLIHTVNKLPNDKAGELFKHILSYVNDENPVTEDLIIQIAFEPVKLQLKRDLVKWENYIEKQRINGRSGGRPVKAKETQKTQAFFKEPKKADTVNVTVTDNVNDNVIEEDTHTVFAKKLSSNELEIVAIQDSTRKIVTSQILKEFNAHLITESKHHSHYSQWMSHLRNWLNKKPEKEKSSAKKESYAESLLRANAEAKEFLKQMNDAEKD